jgi:hypothetical protein
MIWKAQPPLRRLRPSLAGDWNQKFQVTTKFM